MNLLKIKRALISVSDKTGIVELGRFLTAMGCEIISTGGTRTILENGGIPTTEISTVTGNPEAFGGRMKTISFKIESALLYNRAVDQAEADRLNIEPIDLVICNLYPFEQVANQGVDCDTLIENIDIGGPTMIRAAAKNFKWVTVVTAPEDYAELQLELTNEEGGISYEYRKKMMVKAFNHTADYDALIATTMDKQIGTDSLRLSFERGYPLRYGENSHQSATCYRERKHNYSLFDLEVLHGKALSFNNILDINAAIESIQKSERVACSVVKHSNPCGFAEADDQRRALELAWAGDPISAFGSIVAFNKTLTLDTVQFFDLSCEDRSKRKFVEVITAPKVEAEALAYLQVHKNLRVVELDSTQLSETRDYRYVNGALLAQDQDNVSFEQLLVVTKRTLELNKTQGLIEFGLRAVRNIKSNAIAIVREKQGAYQLLGMGAGQPNRLLATKLAIEKCRENMKLEFTGSREAFDAFAKAILATSFLISDAFLPFADNIELAAAEGIRHVVQPGGSIRDQSVIKKCNELAVAMVFTGTRHFKH